MSRSKESTTQARGSLLKACHAWTYWFFPFMLLLLLMVIPLTALQPPAPLAAIVLQAEPLSFTPKEFYIAGVIDARESQQAVAWLLPPDLQGAPQGVDLAGGAQKAILQFTRQSLKRNTKLRPVIIRLQECMITEEASEEKGRVAGRVAVAMSFEMERDGELVPLVAYTGGVRYSRNAEHLKVVEPALRRSLASALEYLNNWMNEEAPRNENLARAVKVHFTDHARNTAEDTVFYAPDRPLIWDDFQGKPRPGRYAASVMPSFSYGGPSTVVEGIIHLNLVMKVYVLKENCWVTPAVKNDYGLNHEQRHFDIVKLVAEQFKKKIQAMELPVVDYGGIIAYEYIESFREMNKLQEQYDDETGHGLNQSAQARWNQRIATELEAIGKN